MTIRTKICGLRRPADVSAAASAGANYIGLNFFPKSKRYVDLAQARALALDVSLGIAKVGLVVDEDNATIDAITAEVPLDMLQLHGSETPERVAEIKARYGLPVMKVIGVAEARDLAALDDYAGTCDQIMLDAKPPKDAILPGGNGIAFDWRLIAGRQWSTPWMLAGGLTPDNVAEAIRLTGANQVDVASGVESAPGVKDAKLMHDFVQAATGDS